MFLYYSFLALLLMGAVLFRLSVQRLMRDKLDGERHMSSDRLNVALEVYLLENATLQRADAETPPTMDL